MTASDPPVPASPGQARSDPSAGASPAVPAAGAGGPAGGGLAVDFFQIADDSFMAEHRADGTGFALKWADVRRGWMDDTPGAFAYRCLPLTIANQFGWHVTSPVGFTAFWRGGGATGQIDIRFDAHPEFWKHWINDQFGQGILTWNTPYLVRTRPAGSRLLVTGPANYFRRHVQPLTAVIETDWMTASFTMNYKITEACEPVRFEAGEPLMQLLPIGGDVYGELEQARVSVRKLADDPATMAAYQEWQTARTAFHQAKAKGEVKGDDWQKDYFRGRDMAGEVANTTRHATKLRPPKVEYPGREKSG